MSKRKTKAKTEGGEREANRAAVESMAETIATKAEPALAHVLTGGTGRMNTDQAHYIAAAIARDSDAGRTRPISEYVNEARRR
jgi:hypothetical protein